VVGLWADAWGGANQAAGTYVTGSNAANILEYEDFSLKIEPRRGEVYPVSVLRSPAGETRSSFQLPFDPAEIGQTFLDRSLR